MKNPRLLTSFTAAITAASLCNASSEAIDEAGMAAEIAKVADTSAETVAGATAEAIAAASASAADAVRKRAAASNFLPIVRGRLPLIFVHAIRFDPTIGAMANKDTATKFATSVGKVFDIKKGRNFAYITSDYKPSAEDLAAAQAWIDQTGASNAKGLTAVGDKTLMATVLEQYKAGGLASAEQAAKLVAARTVTRVAKASQAAAPAGQGLPATTSTAQAAAAGTADDLLA